MAEGRGGGARYIVGIDLGTTNCALACADLAQLTREGAAPSVAEVPVWQLVGPGECAQRALLPSNIYLPSEHELTPGALRLPWGEERFAVGELAKSRGAQVPGRFVSSAKSWLCHAGVARDAPILPWGAPEGVDRLSPIEASAHYLRHLAAAWEASHPGATLSEQEVLLTVPASFDEVARELTVRAAREAGIAKLTLVEEPQAAFQDWISRGGKEAARNLGEHRLILVVDVGGGTSDFTLVKVTSSEREGRTLERVAVGEHILLGGDNMDSALARRVEARLGQKLEAARWSALVQSCRRAKEELFAPDAPERRTVSVAGRGSGLVGGTLSAELSREEVRRELLDGFFPRTRPGDLPQRGGRAGLMELGLPYASDPAITRHLAAFLTRHAAALGDAGSAMLRPDAILLNGGVFTPRAIAERLIEVVSGWFSGRPPIARLELAEGALELAVARGAVFRGLARRGLAPSIGGGSSRGYYVEIETPQGARALCLIPRGMEEGREVELPRTFALSLERPVRFELLETRTELPGAAGELHELESESEPDGESRFHRLPPIETRLSSGAESPQARGNRPPQLPVRLRAALSEIGTLELWCQSAMDERRWKLEFQLRGGAGAEGDGALAEVAPMPKRFGEARVLVERVFGAKAIQVERREIKDLARDLERTLGARDGWSSPLCRELWSALHAGFARRRRTADHERLWCNLTGYCLRPGFGAPLDGWRAGETFKAFEQGLQYRSEPHNWEAWWVMWRRVAGGLDAAQQGKLFEQLEAALRPQQRPKGAATKSAKGGSEGTVEMVRLLGALERIEPRRKEEAGEWLLRRLEVEGPAEHLLWTLGRLGARVPFAGSSHEVISVTCAEEWLGRLMPLAGSAREGAALSFALCQLARLSGDRHRDLAAERRAEVLAVLGALKAPPELRRHLMEVVADEAGERARLFGESLPAGLTLLE